MNLSETKNNLLKYYDFEEFNKEYNETLRIKIFLLLYLKKLNERKYSGSYSSTIIINRENNF